MKKTIMALCVISAMLLLLPHAACAEDKMAQIWRGMNDRERQAYAVGVRDTFSVMCMMTSKGDKDYADCIEEFVMQPDMPESLFAIFDKAYTERKFVNVPPQVLIGIWTTRKGRNIDDDLRMAAEQAAKAK